MQEAIFDQYATIPITNGDGIVPTPLLVLLVSQSGSLAWGGHYCVTGGAR